MRSETWLKIWENKGVSSSEEQHVIDGWDLNSEDEYKELAFSCLTGSEALLSQANLRAVEFGCGSGAFISTLKTKFPNIEIEGVDYSKNLINIAKQKVSGVNFSVLNINDPLDNWKKTLKHNAYDVVFSYGVFLYLNSNEEVLEALTKMKSIINDKGSIIIGEINDLESQVNSKDIRKNALKNRKEKISNLTPDHLYISKNFFKTFADANGFKVEFLPLPNWYPASQYRYHTILKKS